jgi:hypothetical protein
MFPIKTVSAEIQVLESVFKILISKGSDYSMIIITQNSKIGNFSWSDPFMPLMGDSLKSLTSQVYSDHLAQTITSPFLLCLSLDQESYVTIDQDVNDQGIILNEISTSISKLFQQM